MNLDWIYIPITGYLALGLALCAAAALFLTVKREITQLRRTSSLAVAELSERVKALSAALEDSRQKDEALPATAPPEVQLSPGLNVTRRARALRMYRRGESAETISSTMRVPENEVRLLLRIEELLQAKSALDTRASSASARVAAISKTPRLAV
jgi:hypothetical protein